MLPQPRCETQPEPLIPKPALSQLRATSVSPSLRNAQRRVPTDCHSIQTTRRVSHGNNRRSHEPSRTQPGNPSELEHRHDVASAENLEIRHKRTINKSAQSACSRRSIHEAVKFIAPSITNNLVQMSRKNARDAIFVSIMPLIINLFASLRTNTFGVVAECWVNHWRTGLHADSPKCVSQQ